MNQSPCPAFSRAASIRDLRVNDLEAPVGIDDPTPSFSRKMTSDAIGAAQTALDYGTDGIIGKTIHERIEVDGKVIKTYLGSDIDNLTLAHTYTHTQEIPLYNVGWREGTKEYTFFDNLVVRDRRFYNTYDVTWMLDAGAENALFSQ